MDETFSPTFSIYSVEHEKGGKEEKDTQWGLSLSRYYIVKQQREEAREPYWEHSADRGLLTSGRPTLEARGHPGFSPPLSLSPPAMSSEVIASLRESWPSHLFGNSTVLFF